MTKKPTKQLTRTYKINLMCSTDQSELYKLIGEIQEDIGISKGYVPRAFKLSLIKHLSRMLEITIQSELVKWLEHNENRGAFIKRTTNGEGNEHNNVKR